MPEIETFDSLLAEAERKVLSDLTSPFQIQSFLDACSYSADEFYRCPLRVLRERSAHCFDGALFAAAALRRLGHPPRILNMIPDERDDDHLLALFRYEGRWGSVAKSNFVGLRFREPVFRTLRELVLSYFEQYYNVAREKTLRGYTVPLSLKAFDRLGWMVRDDTLERIAERLDLIRRVSLFPSRMVAILSPVDDRSFEAGLVGSREEGLFKPEGRGRS
jgi:hypothetical protein